MRVSVFIFSVLLILFQTSVSFSQNDQWIDPLIDTPGKTIGSDFNGDGIHDFIVGAPGNNDGGSDDEGAAYIFFGSTTLSGSKTAGTDEDVEILGKAVNDFLGEGVASAGDLNGDGIDDFIVGARLNDDGSSGDNAGAAYIFFGATNLSGTKDMGGPQSADVTILGKADGDDLGRYVSGAGDVNGDGFDDIIMGARYNDDGPGTLAGAAYIFFGASDLSGTKNLGGGQSADVTILGGVAGDDLGRHTSGAGDVNGDGFDDILIGARRYGADVGEAYLFFGSSTISGTKDAGTDEDVKIRGKAALDSFGVGLSGIGDINDDGFDDIAVTATNNDDGPGNDAGAAYIFFGASTLSGTKNLGGVQSADVTIIGRSASALMGYDQGVSGVGDVNGDGIADFIVGERNANAASIFFGATDLSGTKRLGEGQSADVTITGAGGGDVLGQAVGGGRNNPGS